jgi:hypothetical protein
MYQSLKDNLRKRNKREKKKRVTKSKLGNNRKRWKDSEKPYLLKFKHF